MKPEAEGEVLSAARLERAIADAKPDYTPAEAVAEANRCLYCHDAPCVQACPTGIDIPTFIRKISTGNLRGSARVILSANMLGYSCARACPVEVLCAGACVYNTWHRTPIAIGRLQRHAVEAEFRTGDATRLFSRAPANGHKVACVGAGPAALACAGYLALEGCDVTLYEKRPLPGGLNTTGIAPYKLNVEGAFAEIGFVRSLGVTFRGGVEVGKDVPIASLLEQHEAVFLGPGLGTDARLRIPGEDGPGVSGAVAWIERLKLEPNFAVKGITRAVVIGGGNTAIDAARELRRVGVAEVTMLYRRTEAQMTGYAHELELARKEGILLIERAVPQAFVREGDVLRGITLVDGRTYACDLALVAIGQARLRELAAAFTGVEVNDQGRIVADPVTGATGHPRVWAGGDAIGGELLVTAAQDGKRAARDIARALGLPARPDAPFNAGHR